MKAIKRKLSDFIWSREWITVISGICMMLFFIAAFIVMTYLILGTITLVFVILGLYPESMLNMF